MMTMSGYQNVIKQKMLICVGTCSIRNNNNFTFIVAKIVTVKDEKAIAIVMNYYKYML